MDKKRIYEEKNGPMPILVIQVIHILGRLMIFPNHAPQVLKLIFRFGKWTSSLVSMTLEHFLLLFCALLIIQGQLSKLLLKPCECRQSEAALQFDLVNKPL